MMLTDGVLLKNISFDIRNYSNIYIKKTNNIIYKSFEAFSGFKNAITDL